MNGHQLGAQGEVARQLSGHQPQLRHARPWQPQEDRHQPRPIRQQYRSQEASPVPVRQQRHPSRPQSRSRIPTDRCAGWQMWQRQAEADQK